MADQPLLDRTGPLRPDHNYRIPAPALGTVGPATAPMPQATIAPSGGTITVTRPGGTPIAPGPDTPIPRTSPLPRNPDNFIRGR